MKGIDHKSKFLLTHREREVFELLVQDKTTRDIAGQLFISEKTVRNHISNVMQFEITPIIDTTQGSDERSRKYVLAHGIIFL
ncbi:helix-turn-helix transcriptional regulator [Paenibacillus sp. E222]|uniref:helix-turn-helix domain-containing protein n=1 Tax=Paenibacillus sp. E222 TaxID=2748863 RepID=UPI0027B8B732|nr:helix-turn-helix transcriptional regulator [Paenibacillus sp. E222]